MKNHIHFLLLAAIFLFCSQAKIAFSQGVQITPERKEVERLPETSFQLEDIKALDYPELQVVPRASERLIMESNNIRENGILTVFPYVTSSIFTTLSGFGVGQNLKPDLSQSDRTNTQKVSNVAIGVGVGGLAISWWYIYIDHYGDTVTQIKGLRNKDRRTELLRERLSEEAFEKSASLVSRWKWIFAAGNFIACAALTDKSTGDYNALPTMGMAAALLPIFLKSNFESNYEKQQEYKRKIYAPISWIDYKYDNYSQSLVPAANLAWTF